MKKIVPGFDELALGYRNFREFIEDAERHGIVSTYLGSDDVEIVPAGAPRSYERIRSDLWRAMVYVTEAGSNFYDPESDRVLASGSADAVNADALIPLPKADAALQESWISDFLVSIGDEGREVAARVAKATSLRDKLREVSASDPSVRMRWYRDRTQRVAELLRKWASEHDLQVRLTETGPPRRRREELKKGLLARAGGGDEYERRVRERLHRAIDGMPLADLLRIPLPVEHLIDA